MSNRTADAAMQMQVSVWTVGQFIQKSPFSSFMTNLALWTISSLRWYFHTIGRGGHRGFKALLQYFLPTVMNSILLSRHVTSHWSTIYHGLFVSWGLGRYPSSIISKCYGYACLFALLRMIYYCLCSVFNMQTTLVNQAGINTIILYQTVRDAIYWMWGTCFILGS